jgi:tetratricopeptide (TPR) repeat protein
VRGRLKKILVALGFAALIANCALVGAANETAAALTAEAALILDEFPAADGAYDAAAEKLRQALALDPAYAKAYVQVCRLQIVGGPEFGRLFAGVAAGSAQRAIFKAIDLDPADGNAWVLRAHLLSDMHLQADAKLALIEAERLGADSAWLALNWAEIYEDEGDIERAMEKYRAVVGNAGAKKSALSHAFQELTVYYVARHEWERAEQTYREAVAINPGGAWLRTKYADALLRHGQFSKAISHARETLQIKDYAATRHVLAIALYGRWADAVIKDENRERAQAFYDEAHGLVPDLAAVAVEANQYSGTRIIADALIREGLVARKDVFRRPY